MGIVLVQWKYDEGGVNKAGRCGTLLYDKLSLHTLPRYRAPEILQQIIAHLRCSRKKLVSTC